MMKETKPDVLIVTTMDSTHHEFIVRGMEMGADKTDFLVASYQFNFWKTSWYDVVYVYDHSIILCNACNCIGESVSFCQMVQKTGCNYDVLWIGCNEKLFVKLDFTVCLLAGIFFAGRCDKGMDEGY